MSKVTGKKDNNNPFPVVLYTCTRLHARLTLAGCEQNRQKLAQGQAPVDTGDLSYSGWGTEWGTGAEEKGQIVTILPKQCEGCTDWQMWGKEPAPVVTTEPAPVVATAPTTAPPLPSHKTKKRKSMASTEESSAICNLCSKKEHYSRGICKGCYGKVLSMARKQKKTMEDIINLLKQKPLTSAPIALKKLPLQEKQIITEAAEAVKIAEAIEVTEKTIINTKENDFMSKNVTTSEDEQIKSSGNTPLFVLAVFFGKTSSQQLVDMGPGQETGVYKMLTEKYTRDNIPPRIVTAILSSNPNIPSNPDSAFTFFKNEEVNAIAESFSPPPDVVFTLAL